MSQESAPDVGRQGAQRELYGETWQVRLTRLRAAYRISQGRLAAVVGLSAPMVSQLVSGQRVKISNPVVLARIVRLEEQLADPGVRAGDPVALTRVLEEVATGSPVLTTQVLTADAPTPAPAPAPGALDAEPGVAWLADLADEGELERLAAVAEEIGAVDLARALGRAARYRGLRVAPSRP